MKIIDLIEKLEPHSDLYVRVMEHRETNDDSLPKPGFALPTFSDGKGRWLYLTPEPSSAKRPKRAWDIIEYLRPYAGRDFGYCQIVDGDNPDDPPDHDCTVVLDASCGVVHGLYAFRDPAQKQPVSVEASEVIPQLEPFPEYTVLPARLRKPVTRSGPVIVLVDHDEVVDALVLTDADIETTPQIKAKELVETLKLDPSASMFLATLPNPVRWETQEDNQVFIPLRDRGTQTDILVLNGYAPWAADDDST